MTSPDEFFIQLGVEFSYDKTKLTSLTKEAQKILEKGLSFDKITGNNARSKQVIDLYKTMWADVTVAYQKYLKAQQSGNQKIAKQAQGEIQALQMAIENMYSKATPAAQERLTNAVTEFKYALSQLIVVSNDYDNQLKSAATTTAHLDTIVKQTNVGLERQQISADKITERMLSLNQQLNNIEAAYKSGNLTTTQYRERIEQLSDKLERLQEQERNVYTNTDRLKNTFKESQGSLDDVSSAVNTCDAKLKDMSVTSNLVRSRIDELSASLNSRSGLTRWLTEFKEGFRQGFGQLSGMSAGMQAFQIALQLVQQSIRAVTSEVIELNKAMTEIQMVAGTTTGETMQLFKDYNNLARELSVTTKDVASGAGEWLRQGRSQAETMDLIKASTVQATLAQMDYNTSTTLLTSTLNGYKMSAEEAMHVVDALVQVDFKAATSVQELATALQKTANTASDSGVKFERLLGYLGVVSETTRQAPELIGRSFRTLFSRMQNIRAGVEIDDQGEKLNDVEKVLNRLGIQLRENNNEFRNMTDVLDEVNARWNTFTDLERNQVATSIAGRFCRNL